MSPNQDDTNQDYHHTQRSPLCWLVYAIGLTQLAAAWMVRAETTVAWILAGAGCFLMLLAACFHYLTVEDLGDRLSVRFGPLPFFQRSIRYQDIQSCQPAKTTWLDGWGIHLSLRGGWVWNLWGFDCVVVRTSRGVLWIGTDDPQGLFHFLRSRTRFSDSETIA